MLEYPSHTRDWLDRIQYDIHETLDMKTAVGANTPPSPDEMIEAIGKMTWVEMLMFKAALDELVQRKREEKVREKNEKEY